MLDMAKSRGGGVTRVVMPDGSIKWRARLYLPNKREKNLGLFDDPDAAAAVAAAARAQLATQTTAPHASTLGAYGAAWLDRRELGGKVRGIRQERSAWRSRVAPYPIAELPLQAVTRGHVVRWLRELAAAAPIVAKRTQAGITREPGAGTLTRQSLVHALRLLRLCLRSALDEELITSNPALDVRVPAVSTEGEGDGVSWTWLTADEIATLLETTRVERGTGRGARHDLEDVPEEHRLVWTVAVYTGLRSGELRSLRWSDVVLDGADPRLTVRASHDGPTKSRRSREVPLLPPALTALERWRELRPGIGGAWVFAQADGLRHAAGYRWGWLDWAQLISPRPVRFHDLRHTCASHLIQGTWGRALSLTEVGQWLGHRDAKTTTRYAHLAPDGLRGRGRELAEMWAPKGERERNR